MLLPGRDAGDSRPGGARRPGRGSGQDQHLAGVGEPGAEAELHQHVAALRSALLEQDGRTVFRWAVWHTAKKIREMLERSGIGIEDVDVFVPHQANMRIIDELAKQLKLPEDVVVGRDIAETGNTSAASIPLATHRLLAEGAAESGDVLVQFGFGAGLAYAGQVLILP